MMILTRLILLFSVVAHAIPPTTEFNADHFTRDLRTKTEIGKGKAYLRQEGREIWADEIEYNFDTNKLTAVGNVHLRHKGLDVFCSRGTYSLGDDTALLEDATILTGQMVLSGTRVRQLGPNHYEMEEGFYTNCNNELIKTKEAAECLFDWKIYGRKFDITMEGYFYVYDAIIYAKDLPAMYSPFYMAPAKSKRQSGFLTAGVENTTDIGTGIRVPYYHVLGSWHDLTLAPTFRLSDDTQLATQYRYVYSESRRGELNLFLTGRSINPDRTDPRKRISNKPKTLGLIGEYAIDAENQYGFGNRSHTRQSLLYVSDPYYPVMYTRDLGTKASLGYLRSQITLTLPSDDFLGTGSASYLQSLVFSNGGNTVDKGPAAKLPALGFFKKASELWNNIFIYEFNSRFANFYRGGSGVLDENGYIREGRRLELEPRLIANFPIGSGFQLQPAIRAGELLYHFSLPNSRVVHRESVDVTVPLSMYLTKNFETIRHVVQPRLIYYRSLYYSADPLNDPFFRRPKEPDPTLFTSPRFDFVDELADLEYLRAEISNRFLQRQTADRFLLLEIANQYNAKTNPYDPRFKYRHGPLEILAELNLWRLTFQVQGAYQFTKTTIPGTTERVNESDWSGRIGYAAGGDELSVGASIHDKADPKYDEQTFTLTARKELPIYVHIGGGFEYSAKKGQLRTYNFSVGFAEKPNACWTLSFNFAHDANGINTTLFNFSLLLGGATGLTGT